ncbi:MAG: AtpZ/AtpI family protein [Planctomycetota bacterium]
MSSDPPAPNGADSAEGRAPDDPSGPAVPGPEWVAEQRKGMGAAGAGLQFGFTICIFALAGNWLDGRFDTGPWLLVVGVLLAFAGGTVSLLKKFS